MEIVGSGSASLNPIGSRLKTGDLLPPPAHIRHSNHKGHCPQVRLARKSRVHERAWGHVTRWDRQEYSKKRP